jgi:hypothetical protein
VIISPQTATILYVKIGKQLNIDILQLGGGGAGHAALDDGVTQGVDVGVGVGDAVKQGYCGILALGVGVGVGGAN